MPQSLEERVDDYRQFILRWEGPSLGLTHVAASILTVDASKEIAKHSAVLVRLTWALVATSSVLAALTGVLVWRTFFV
jgi:hypothetical protein